MHRIPLGKTNLKIHMLACPNFIVRMA